ncbi:histidine kinase [Amycolatopsis sp. NPDC051071]|uniref:sensor histidine kinase n=1 Tax=Amycolatopsis sp. NPDC051071 TaxID=3154637 RepID=UPI003430FF37
MRSRPRFVASLLIITLAAWFVARSGFVFSGDYGPSAVGGWPAVVAVVAIGGVVALLYLIAVRALSPRATAFVVVVQALLVFAPYFVAGPVWGPVAGGVVASILFVAPRRVSWPLSVLAIALDIGLSAVFQDPGVDVLALAGRLVIDVLVGLTLFGVMLLTDLTRRVRAEKTAHTTLAVTTERLHNAECLRTELSTDLSAVLRLSRCGVEDEEARARLAEITAHARRAAYTARSIIDTRREIPRQVPAHGFPRATVISPRLAWLFTLVTTTVGGVLLVLVNLGFFVKPSAGGWVLAVLLLVVSAALQMYHGAPRAGDREPRWWPWTLSFHLVTLMVVVAFTGPQFAPAIMLAAGAVLYRCRAPWSLGIVVLVLVELQWVLPPAATLGDRVYLVASLTGSLIQVYAYCHLPDVARALVDARDEHARLAVVRERLRVTRDVHDLLGFSITAIGLKGELITRLIDTDPARARHEIGELRRLAERGLAEVRAVAEGDLELNLEVELRAARALFDAAGIQAESTLDAPVLPAEIDRLLATVVREGATNVIRHAAATACRISLSAEEGTVELRLINDGRPVSSAPGRAGTGLASLGARISAAGGRFAAGADGDHFVLTARIPLREKLYPAGLGRDPDRVDPVLRVQLGDR